MVPTKASISTSSLRKACRQSCVSSNRALLARKRPYSDQASTTLDESLTEGSKAKSIAKEESPASVSTAEKGDAFTRRLEQLAEDAVEASGRLAEPNGFDEGLKRQLEQRILNASLRSSHPQAFAVSGLPTHAGKGVRETAASRAWTGEEALEDATLRMLVDAHKPLRGPKSASRLPAVAPRMPARKPAALKAGTRLAEARDRSSAYTALRDNGMTKDEREAYFREVRARFQPGARDLPSTLTGLASLANERIEEAMARGQFKNLPRGEKTEPDHNSGNPFIDTTEYIMNNMIKKQDIVPPWIEKQQELALAAQRFRLRLRSDWKRHAARVIASKGGSLEAQIQRAVQYAAAELEENPPPVASPTDVGSNHLSQISLSGQLASGAETHDATVTRCTEDDNRPRRPAFRDPQWEATELSFHKLSIDSLNSMTRSYNLIAPRPAQKPYFNLQRELKACYREVAPLLGEEIRQRALAPKKTPEYKLGSGSSGILDVVGKANAKVYDEDLNKKGYGIKEFWRDLWASGRSA